MFYHSHFLHDPKRQHRYTVLIVHMHHRIRYLSLLSEVQSRARFNTESMWCCTIIQHQVSMLEVMSKTDMPDTLMMIVCLVLMTGWTMLRDAPFVELRDAHRPSTIIIANTECRSVLDDFVVEFIVFLGAACSSPEITAVVPVPCDISFGSAKGADNGETRNSGIQSTQGRRQEKYISHYATSKGIYVA